MGRKIAAAEGEWGVLKNNTKRLNDYIRIAAKGRSEFTTKLSALATGSGLAEDDVRASAALLLFAGDIADIIPASGGRIKVFLEV